MPHLLRSPIEQVEGKVNVKSIPQANLNRVKVSTDSVLKLNKNKYICFRNKIVTLGSPSEGRNWTYFKLVGEKRGVIMCKNRVWYWGSLRTIIC